MTETKRKTGAAPEDDHGLEEKIQDYHRKGGPQGDHRAKRIEGDIANSGIPANDALEKGKPLTTPNDLK